MALDFPNTPVTNDTFTSGTLTWKYDGTKWNLISRSNPVNVNLSDSNPVMNGTASAGTNVLGSRADHVHPSDTSKVGANSPTFTGTVTTPLTTAGIVTTTSGGVLGSSSYQRIHADLYGYTSTPTAGSSTTLTNTSTVYQIFTGSSNQTIVLPVTSTLVTGWLFHIVNNSTGTLTVNSSGGNLVTTVPSQTTAMVSCIGTTLTTAADWEAGLTDFSTYTGTGSVVLANSPSISGGVAVTAVNSSTVPLSITGASAQATDFLKVSDSSSNILINVTSAGTFNVNQGSIIPMVGTTSEAPIDFQSGTNLSVAQQGAMEFDGDNLFITGDTTNGSSRMVIPSQQKYWLNSSANAIAANTDFFPSARPAMKAGRLYHFRYFLIFQKNTAGTVTFQLKNSAAVNFTYIDAHMSVFVQGAVLAALGNVLNAYAAGAATATFTATQSLANNASCVAIVDGYCVPASNTRLSIAPSAYGAGTITTSISSNYIITDLGTSSTNYGNFG